MITDYKEIYDQEALEKDPVINNNRPYQQCAKSVMDTIADPNIVFDSKGVSNYHDLYQTAAADVKTGADGEAAMTSVVAELKARRSRKSEFDCVIGLSGGVDSSYIAYLAKSLDINPLLVHFDYGWNSEIAVQNISKIVRKTGFEFYTHVMDWEEFKDLQRSYFKASVIDLDVPADHMIRGALHQVANEYNITSILHGYNAVTEGVMPVAWNYDKSDLTNINNIHSRFGDRKLKYLPKFGMAKRVYYYSIKEFKSYTILNYVAYNKQDAINTIQKELGWIDYGGKHHESVFTRFYQGFILPNKFNVDKRKAHLSTMIFSGQISKEEALSELKEPTYDIDLINKDRLFVGKKLGFTEEEFDAVLSLPNKAHEFYGSDKKLKEQYAKYVKYFKFIKPLVRKITG